MHAKTDELLDENWYQIDVYQLDKAHRGRWLLDRMKALTEWHYGRCLPYRRLIEASPGAHFGKNAEKIEDIPYLWARLFKMMPLSSLEATSSYKSVYSSGTSGIRSEVLLDKMSAQRQSKTLVAILKSWIGKNRYPMIIVDVPETAASAPAVSARAAGVLGLSMFAKSKCIALKPDGSLDVDAIKDFLSAHQGEDIILFGFTFLVWSSFIQPLLAKDYGLDLSRVILFHSGGWKKMIDSAVSPDEFNAICRSQLGIGRVHNFYGMAEQTGVIHVACEFGFLHTPIFADVIVRDTVTFKPVGTGESGLLQVLSVLPTSYPGHSIMTEDVGVILGEDDCPCGRLGKRFIVEGRIAKADARGCSDTFSGFQAG